MAVELKAAMDKGELRKLLLKSKQEPLNCAVATGDGRKSQPALILLDRRKPPKTLMKELEKQFPEARNPRFGTAQVDPEADAKLVLLRLNAGASGLAERLAKSLKGTGFSKVKIMLGDGTVAEQVEEPEAGQAAAPATAPARPAAEAAAVTPAAKAAAAPPDAAAAQAAARTATNAKARAVWVATRQKVERDLGTLHGAFASAFKGHAAEGKLIQAFRARVDTVLDTLGEELAHTLDAVNGAADPAQRQKLVEQAHAHIAQYTKHVATDHTIGALDRNPFVPLSIGKTMSATLAALSKTIR
jgi:hypothetical protein